MYLKEDYFGCICYSPDHCLVVIQDEAVTGKNKWPPELWLEVHLRKQRLRRRIWNAIRHIFGYKCRYGCFDTFEMRPEDADRFIEILQKFKQRSEDFKKSDLPS